MKSSLKPFIAFALLLPLFGGCTKNKPSNPPAPSQDGYLAPGGVFVLNQSARMTENSSVTYIDADWNIEENIYRNANGTAFGNEAQDMYFYNGKAYILSNCLFTPNGEDTDGVIVIADGQTFKKEKAYKANDLRFQRPEGSLADEELLEISTPFENIIVLDEKNIFIEDEQALFRFDSTTGELFIIEGAYHFGNQGNTIENVGTLRGAVVVGDCLYCSGGGFWESTRLFELSKDKNEVNRVIPDLKGDFISGLAHTAEHEIMLATCGRGGEKKSYLYFVDIDKWKIVKEKQVPEDLSAEFFNTSGIAHIGDYIYYAAGSTTVRRLSLKSWQAEDYIDVTKDAPESKYLNCNVIADPQKQYLYIAVSDEYSESIVPSTNYLLVYDCSSPTPQLVKNIVNKTRYPIGVYPISKFQN